MEEKEPNIVEKYYEMPVNPLPYFAVGCAVGIGTHLYQYIPVGSKPQPFLQNVAKSSLLYGIYGTVFTVGYHTVSAIRSKYDLLSYTAGGTAVGLFNGATRTGTVHSCIVQSVVLGLLTTAAAYMGHLPLDYNKRTKEEIFMDRYVYLRPADYKPSHPVLVNRQPKFRYEIQKQEEMESTD